MILANMVPFEPTWVQIAYYAASTLAIVGTGIWGVLKLTYKIGGAMTLFERAIDENRNDHAQFGSIIDQHGQMLVEHGRRLDQHDTEFKTVRTNPRPAP